MIHFRDLIYHIWSCTLLSSGKDVGRAVGRKRQSFLPGSCGRGLGLQWSRNPDSGCWHQTCCSPHGRWSTLELALPSSGEGWSVCTSNLRNERHLLPHVLLTKVLTTFFNQSVLISSKVQSQTKTLLETFSFSEHIYIFWCFIHETMQEWKNASLRDRTRSDKYSQPSWPSRRSQHFSALCVGFS